MSLVQIYIPTEAAQSVVADLGELGIIQFSDLNPGVSAFQKTFTSEIRELDELERKIKFLWDQAKIEGVEVRSWATVAPESESDSSLRGKALGEVDELYLMLGEVERRVLQLSGSQNELQERFLQLLDHHAVLCALAPFLDVSGDGGIATAASFDEDSSTEARRDDFIAETLELGGPGGAQMSSEANFIAGALPKAKLAAFERVLWRALRGNVLIRSADLCLEAPGALNNLTDGLKEPKSAFVAFVHGRETFARLRKICTALGCSIHDVDPWSERRRVMLDELTIKLDDLYAIIFNTRQAKRGVLRNVSDSLERWLILIRKKKAVYHTLNRFSCDGDASTRKYYLAEGWCPSNALPALDMCVKAASDRIGISVSPVVTILDPGLRQPPTHFPTNKFTQVFQDITDAYGVGSYGEINPSLYMIVSFPFLFAVMFGDAGHAAMMTGFSLWMVLSEKKLLAQKQSDIFEMIFTGRYVILLMGLFSIFTGFIYNDCFSRAMAIFPSAYSADAGGTGSASRSNPSYVYPFGIDPVWSLSSNMMIFMNSYKMKQSVILGICQMLFGIILSAFNYVHLDKRLDLYCVFLPQMIFMVSIFGYMCLMIIYKWISGWDASILTLFITMILRLGAVEGVPIYRGQEWVQPLLLIVAFICVPWMLLAKPLMLMLERRTLTAQGYQHADSLYDGYDSGKNEGTESISSTTRKAGHDAEEHGMGELWVHQVIHTIEFVLGSVSNTASYLRLWALSLAHAELSEVLWQMAIARFVKNPFILFFSFWVWFGFTVAILVGMEGMSAFLHALRLHWVEFNNKFYLGNGQKFEPFSLQVHILTASWEDSCIYD